jgi:succinoglycan biosynthesis protein ExoA
MSDAVGDQVDVTVLVPVLNEGRRIVAPVAAMRSQSFDGVVEFLLLDGGSTDSTLTEVQRLVGADPRFRIVRGNHQNIPALLNLGLRLAQGEVIARMDAHTLFPPNYLADGFRRLRRGDVASVSGPQIAWGDAVWGQRVAIAQRSPLARGGARFRQLGPREIEVDSGYCGMWRRSLLLAHGGWNEVAPQGEDAELAARIRRSGGRIVCIPEMAARYLPRDTLRRLAIQYWRYAYRRVWIAHRHPFALRRSQLLPPATVVATFSAMTPPSALSRLARRITTLYVIALIGESVRVGRDQALDEVIALPAVFATMHLSWGLGFVAGCIRYGPPWKALALQLCRGSSDGIARTGAKSA